MPVGGKLMLKGGLQVKVGFAPQRPGRAGSDWGACSWRGGWAAALATEAGASRWRWPSSSAQRPSKFALWQSTGVEKKKKKQQKKAEELTEEQKKQQEEARECGCSPSPRLGCPQAGCCPPCRFWLLPALHSSCFILSPLSSHVSTCSTSSLSVAHSWTRGCELHRAAHVHADTDARAFPCAFPCSPACSQGSWCFCDERQEI